VKTRRTSEVTRATLVIAMCGVGTLLHALSLGGQGALGDSLGHECHELADGATLVKRKLGEIGRADEDGGGWRVAGYDGEDGKLIDSHTFWQSLGLAGGDDGERCCGRGSGSTETRDVAWRLDLARFKRNK
jgi:hypothetical protein